MVKRSAPTEASSTSAPKKTKISTEKPITAKATPATKPVKAAKAETSTKTKATLKATAEPEVKKGKSASLSQDAEAPAPAVAAGKKRKTAADLMDSEPTTSTITSSPKKAKVSPAVKSTATESAAESKSTTTSAVTTTIPKPLKSALKQPKSKSILSKPASTPNTTSSTRPTRSSKPSKATDPSSAAAANYIAGFSSSSESGSDDEDDEDVDVDMDGGKGVDKKGVDIRTLPTIAKDDKTVMRKLEKSKRKGDTQKGTLYLGRIPHGFYEQEMKSYFEQFGEVTRLRLSRSRKTGASKHYAYIEFASKSVAEITADTMNNYLLMGHILQCHIVPPSELHPDTYLHSTSKYKSLPPAQVQAARLKKLKTGDEKVREKANGRLKKRDEKRKETLKAKGIEYEYTL